MKITLPHVAVFCLMFVSGCAHQIHPVARPEIDASLRNGSYKIREFHGSGAVTLVNGQPAENKYLIVKAGVHSYYGNRREWGDIVIQLTERELAKRGLHSSANGKKITMVVESLQIDTGMWTHSSSAVLKVQVGDGFTATYSGDDTGLDFNNIACEALVHAISKMLNDPRFVAAVTR